MCFAVPMKVTRIDGNMAQVEIGGTYQTIGLDMLDHKPVINQYVIVHAGFAIRIIDKDEFDIPVEDFEELLTDDEAPLHGFD